MNRTRAVMNRISGVIHKIWTLWNGEIKAPIQFNLIVGNHHHCLDFAKPYADKKDENIDMLKCQVTFSPDRDKVQKGFDRYFFVKINKKTCSKEIIENIAYQLRYLSLTLKEDGECGSARDQMAKSFAKSSFVNNLINEFERRTPTSEINSEGVDDLLTLLNTGTTNELLAPKIGIGPKTAPKIIENRSFAFLDDAQKKLGNGRVLQWLKKANEKKVFAPINQPKVAVQVVQSKKEKEKSVPSPIQQKGKIWNDTKTQPYLLSMSQIESVSVKGDACNKEISKISKNLEDTQTNFVLPVAEVTEQGDKYRLLSGGDIFEAAKLAGLKELWVFLISPSKPIETKKVLEQVHTVNQLLATAEPFVQPISVLGKWVAPPSPPIENRSLKDERSVTVLATYLHAEFRTDDSKKPLPVIKHLDGKSYWKEVFEYGTYNSKEDAQKDVWDTEGMILDDWMLVDGHEDQWVRYCIDVNEAHNKDKQSQLVETREQALRVINETESTSNDVQAAIECLKGCYYSPCSDGEEEIHRRNDIESGKYRLQDIAGWCTPGTHKKYAEIEAKAQMKKERKEAEQEYRIIMENEAQKKTEQILVLEAEIRTAIENRDVAKLLKDSYKLFFDKMWEEEQNSFSVVKEGEEPSKPNSRLVFGEILESYVQEETEYCETETENGEFDVRAVYKGEPDVKLIQKLCRFSDSINGKVRELYYPIYQDYIEKLGLEDCSKKKEIKSSATPIDLCSEYSISERLASDLREYLSKRLLKCFDTKVPAEAESLSETKIFLAKAKIFKLTGEEAPAKIDGFYAVTMERKILLCLNLTAQLNKLKQRNLLY